MTQVVCFASRRILSSVAVNDVVSNYGLGLETILVLLVLSSVVLVLFLVLVLCICSSSVTL